MTYPLLVLKLQGPFVVNICPLTNSSFCTRMIYTVQNFIHLQMATWLRRVENKKSYLLCVNIFSYRPSYAIGITRATFKLVHVKDLFGDEVSAKTDRIKVKTLLNQISFKQKGKLTGAYVDSLLEFWSK